MDPLSFDNGGGGGEAQGTMRGRAFPGCTISGYLPPRAVSFSLSSSSRNLCHIQRHEAHLTFTKLVSIIIELFIQSGWLKQQSQNYRNYCYRHPCWSRFTFQLSLLECLSFFFHNFLEN